jgi:Lectin C-type domain
MCFITNKATWEEAQKACHDIGTKLLAVEYDEKDTCVANLAKGITCPLNIHASLTRIWIFLAHFALRGVSFWTSGTDMGCKGKNHWCSINRGITNRNMSWSSQKDGDCISIQFTNQSQFSKSPCTNKLNYVCEVIYFWVNNSAIAF